MSGGVHQMVEMSTRFLKGHLFLDSLGTWHWFIFFLLPFLKMFCFSDFHQGGEVAMAIKPVPLCISPLLSFLIWLCFLRVKMADAMHIQMANFSPLPWQFLAAGLWRLWKQHITNWHLSFLSLMTAISCLNCFMNSLWRWKKFFIKGSLFIQTGVLWLSKLSGHVQFLLAKWIMTSLKKQGLVTQGIKGKDHENIVTKPFWLVSKNVFKVRVKLTFSGVMNLHKGRWRLVS